MKIKKPKIPFSAIVEESGLNRAARWMPFAAAAFILMLGSMVCVYPQSESLVNLFLDAPEGLPWGVSCASAFLFAAFEFFGSLLDLLSAWLRLRKSYS